MKIKIIDTSYDTETKISTVIINTDLGKFTGKARLHEEDIDIESSFAGYNYAEARAIIKYMKEKVRILNYKIDALANCEKAIKSNKNSNWNSLEFRSLRKQKFILEKERKLWKERVKSLHQDLFDKMSNRRKMLDDMIKKAKGDDK